MGKRQEAAMETRQKIIEAMRTLLQEKAASDINIEEITQRAGVAKGSFYTHFKRKEDVISVIAMECYNTVKESVFRSDAGICEQISAYLRGSAQIIARNTLQIAQNWMKSVAAPLPDEQGGMEKYRYDYDNLMEMLRRAVQSGELQSDTPCDMLVQNIMNSYYGAVAVWCITSGEADLIRGIEDFCTLGLRAILRPYLTKEDA